MQSQGLVIQTVSQQQQLCCAARTFQRRHIKAQVKLSHQQFLRHQSWQAAPVTSCQTQVAAAAQPAATVAAAADPCLELSGLKAKAVGSLLAAMCGNALGAQVEPEKHYRLSRMFPNGLHDLSWTFDISTTPLPPGHVTGDFEVMAAVAHSLVRSGAADAIDVAECMAAVYDPSAAEQWYSPYTQLMLEGLSGGSNPFLLAQHADGYLASTASRASNSASHRPGRQLHGIDDFSVLMRVIPVAIAYRDAPVQELRTASDAVVLFTHPSDTAADAAAILAAAVAWCIRADPDSTSPEQLLAHLQADVASTADMKNRLALLQDRLPVLAGLDSIDNWSAFWRSREWGEMTSVANLLTKQNLAIKATKAATLALWVCVASWRHPQQAVMMAASLGGYAATTGALVGGLVGALHGCSWVPAHWWSRLQDELQEELHDDVAAQAGTGQHREQHQQEPEGTDAAAVENNQGLQEVRGGEEELSDDWSSRPVSKYSVVVLGHQLADLDCKQTIPLL